MSDIVTLNMDSDGVAHIVFNDPEEQLNTLSPRTLEAIDEAITDLSHRHDVRALIFSSGKEGCFIAGADLRQISKVFPQPSLAKPLIAQGQNLFNKIAALPFPTIAVINGVCLGGGLELALAFTYRIATDHSKTVLALPETTIGIMPGWGGTQRAPRLVGLQNGLSMIVSGKQHNPKEAYKMHLVDAVVPWPFAEEEAIAFAHDVLTPAGQKKVLKRRNRSWMATWLVEKNPIGRALLFHAVRKQVLKKTKGHYPAPMVAIRTIEETYTLPLDKGLERETENFINGLSLSFVQAPNLVGLFFAQEAIKKDFGSDAQPRTIKSAGVLGAGAMGSGITWLMTFKDIPTRFKEANWEAVAKGYSSIYDTYGVYVKKLRKLKPDLANYKFHLASGTTDFSGFQAADIVIEAVVEDLDIKKQLLTELEANLSEHAIIATNTSSLSVSALSSVLERPERFIGMHFFNPVSRMPLVEVVPGPQTSADTIATVIALCRRLDKVPLVVKDVPGFLVNRIFVMAALEAMHLLQEGVEMEHLEKIMLDFGMPMGPFELSDEVGIDVTYKVAVIFEGAYGERARMPPLLKAMYEDNLWGRKVGKGFYVYKGSDKKPNKQVKKLAKKFRKDDAVAITDETIIERMLYVMVNEASRCLDEEVVAKPEYVDLAMVMGTGFPPFRGGLLRYADSIGTVSVVDKLRQFAQTYGSRFAPSDRLLEMQANGSTFY
ncbi:MAG: 3-hydroxyacyl-CoA dehydrogenase NAD-binding domain-containing protein [Chlamydiales bacterium]|nr:3-hydroxyacyl-CoA dehydrogenase NAD-binding domain-containing protein [Chlamydiales bacterium]